MPYPIPNLDGIKIEWLHESKQPDPFNILLLGEGFANSDNDLKRFKDFTESLSDNFFAIPPFQFCRPYINIFSCFIASPSNESGIQEQPPEWEEGKEYNFGDRVIFHNRPYVSTCNNNFNSPYINEENWREESWDDLWKTIFSIYIKRDEHGIGKFKILERTRPIDIVRLLNLPDGFEAPPWLENTTSSIWMDHKSKSFGAICIIVNTIQDDGIIEDIGNWNLAGYPSIINFDVASDVNSENDIIDRYEIEYRSMKKISPVLVVRATNNPVAWTIAGFNDEGELRTFNINDPDYELYHELKNAPIDEAKIVELASSILERTYQNESLRNIKYKPPWKYFVIDMHGFFEPTTYRREDGSTFDLKGGYAETFVHELGHSLDLADEYIALDEIPPIELQTQGIGSGRYKNVDNSGVLSANPDTSNEDIRNFMSSDEFLKRLRWRRLLTSAELERLVSGQNIFTRQDLENIDSNIFVDFREMENYENNPRTGKPLHWNQIYLIEGAKYKRDFIRSNFECRMRHSKYFSARSIEDQIAVYDKFKQKTRDGEYRYGSPEFCRVCNYQIRHHITGYTEFGIGGIDRNRLQFIFDNEIMPRIIKSFRIWNNVTGSDLSVARAVCHIASIRAYIMFKNLPEALNVKLNITKDHVSIFYNGIICDPTFYDLFRLATNNEPVTSSELNGNSDLHYQVSLSEVRPFKNWEVNRGFIGSPGEIRAYVYRRRMRMGSYGNPGQDWVDFLHPDTPIYELAPMVDEVLDIIMEANYGEKQYLGPDNPEYENIARDLGFGNLLLDAMKNEWERWLMYKELKDKEKALPSDRSLDYLIPIDMSLSLQTVLNL